MGEQTAIEWTDATWNPWYGCSKVSPGCAHCYMFRDQTRYGRDPEIVTRSKTKFTEPLRWKEGRRVFTCSWSDWFHESADAWRDEAWDIIRRTPQHTYQILTKRPERMADHLPANWGEGYRNVWLGVSVENQRWTARIPELLAVPAAVRFLSCEPLLGPLDIGRYLAGWDSQSAHVCGGDEERCWRQCPVEEQYQTERVDWVIVGGESGPDARAMHEVWAKDIQAQCEANGVAFFLKQLGGATNPRAHDLAVLDGKRYVEMPRQFA